MRKKFLKNHTKKQIFELFRPFWIGQGFGYKQFDFDWEYGDPDEVIYVPEYAYDGDGDKELSIENCYTKADFVRIAKSEQEGKNLFQNVDWQHPETLQDENEREISNL